MIPNDVSLFLYYFGKDLHPCRFRPPLLICPYSLLARAMWVFQLSCVCVWLNVLGDELCVCELLR